MKSRAQLRPPGRRRITALRRAGHGLTGTCPVPRLRKILVPLDFSEHSNTALRWALGLAGSSRASLVLLYVAETNPAGSEFGVRHLPQLETDLRKIGRRQLARIKRTEIPTGFSCTGLIHAGKADAQIVEVAKALKADLIVMGTHSHASERGQLGCTCERVARFAHCPVLLVPVQEKHLPFFL